MHESAGGFYMKQKFVPAVYAENPMGVSEKYSFIPTTRVIDDLGQLGWHPEVITGSRHNPVAKHLIRFRQSEIVGPETPEIVLVNSHDGLSSFQLKAGIFRLVCGNGLVIAESLFSAISIRHIHYTFDAVQAAVAEFADGIPVILDSVETFKRRELSIAERLIFAKSALQLRWPDNTPAVDLARFLGPRRPADQGVDLWRTLNVVQEKLLNGRFCDATGTKVRALSNVDRVVKLNQSLFELALEYAA
jgi:hypothetical protein